MKTIHDRLGALRAAMRSHALDCYLIPSADEHLDEYVPPWRLRREFMSGFSGSAGDLLVGLQRAWLYVDSRYHLQADSECEGSGIETAKLGVEGVRPLGEHLGVMARERAGLKVGIDPMVIPLSLAESLRATLEEAGGQLVELEGNLVDPLWQERPAPPTSKLMPLPLDWCGQSATEKIAAIRKDLDEQSAEAIAVIKLDQIAWLLNLRSLDDIPFNPVFEAALFLDREAVHLFLHGGAQRLPAGYDGEIADLMTHPYGEFTSFLAACGSRRVLVEPDGITRGVALRLEAGGADLVRAPSPLEKRKAHKNEAERAALRRANLRASAAKTRALLWLRREIAAGRGVTEASFRDRIESLYAQQKGYQGLSFATISSTGAHGAIIHYSSCDETPLREGELFLIDSGAHIDGGTTDDTRTVGLGRCGAEERRVYTAVLQAHLNAARQRFPDRAPGTALDALARSPLWNQRLEYGHGTGHGVGAFLNVHEGPFSISSGRVNSGHPLSEDLVSSIEPGYYREGWGGARIENLYLFVPDGKDASGRTWLRLEPLTWIPFDSDLIEEEMLQPLEKSWIEEYHSGCLEHLAPLLPAEELAELRAWIHPARA